MLEQFSASMNKVTFMQCLLIYCAKTLASSMHSVKSCILYSALQNVLQELSIDSEEECHRLCAQAKMYPAIRDNWALCFCLVWFFFPMV